MKSRVKIEKVTYEMAENAPLGQVLLWVVTGGRFGRLFQRKNQDFNKYSADTVNCRCVTRPAHLLPTPPARR